MKEIHLMGLGPGWSHCPPCGPGVRVWGINNVLNWREVDYVFEVHNWRKKMYRLKGGCVHQNAMNVAREKKIPYIVREKWDFVPGLIQYVYPWQKIYNEFKTDFIGCSMDCMVAMAIYCGYQIINVWGLGINRASEYDYQIESQNFWFGVCVGRKIDLRIHNYTGFRHTDVLRTRNGLVYGIGTPQTINSYGVDPTLPPCDCTKRHEALHSLKID